PWHSPVLLAGQAATRDLLSGGRLDFGVGKGYRYNEFAGFCVDMDEADARFTECLDVVMKAWTSDRPFSHRGKYWAFDDIVVEPPTAQHPHPPIWMGAGGESSVRRVAEAGYNLLLGQYAQPADVGRSMYGTPDQIAEKLDELRRAGVGYVLVNGGGSGGGERGRASLRRFAREVMPLFEEAAPARAAE